VADDDLIAFAGPLAAEVGAYAAAEQAHVEEEQKSDDVPITSSIVTAVDREAERRIVDALEARFPDDGILGEEFARKPSRSGRTWLIDPIDGTLNYARRLGPWSVVISAWDDLSPVAVAVWSEGHLYAAAAGGGATLDGQRLHIDGRDLGGRIALVPPAFAAAAEEAGLLARGIHSSAVELMATADGRVGGTIRPRGHPRDLHGPALIVSEAGGVVTDLEGDPGWNGTTRGLVAGTPSLHPALLELVRRRRDGRRAA
jgi:myo-inositol-1(or 4)-monophosphatase